MTIRIQSASPIAIKSEMLRPGLSTSVIRYPKTYAVVSGGFGTPTYKEVPIREGRYKKMKKQHKARNNGFLLIRHGYAFLSL